MCFYLVEILFICSGLTVSTGIKIGVPSLSAERGCAPAVDMTISHLLLDTIQ